MARLRGDRPAPEVEARYRAACRRLFELARRGPDADPAQCTRALDELIALTDDLGPERSDMARHEEARRWWRETGCCPWSGERGEYHGPPPRP